MMFQDKELDIAAKKFNIHKLKNYYEVLAYPEQALLLILPTNKNLVPIGHGIEITIQAGTSSVLVTGPDILTERFHTSSLNKIGLKIYKGLLWYGFLHQFSASDFLKYSGYISVINNSTMTLAPFLDFTNLVSQPAEKND